MAESDSLTGSTTVTDANDDRPYCFYLSETMTTQHADGSRHYYPAIVRENDPGYYRTDWDYGTDFHLAKRAVASLNQKRGIPPDVVSRIVMSSMFPKADANRHDVTADAP